MAYVSDDSSLSSDQDTNQFFVQVEIEPQISYTTIKDLPVELIGIHTFQLVQDNMNHMIKLLLIFLEKCLQINVVMNICFFFWFFILF